MINVQPSVDPVQTLLSRSDPSPFDKSAAAGLVGMVYLARQAFEERRRRQCLEITMAILKLEPGHEEARSIRAAVRADLDRDFATARALVGVAFTNGDRALYARASGLLRRIVEAEPENLEAQSLLNETMAAGYFGSETQTVRTRPVSLSSILVGCLVVAVLVTSFFLRDKVFAIASALLPTSEAANAETVAQTDINSNATDPVAGPAAVPAIDLRSDNQTVPRNPAVRPKAVPQSAAAAPPALPEAPVMGFLAVSSAVPVDIYRGNELLASTPTTLELAAGPQTLEYRYQGLRQTLTHVVTGRETTTAAISFPIRVQINAKPWAQVFLDGTRQTPIGQTPLGDVSVPIGSILLFQNPGYPDKRYRVTATDAAIQVTFP